MNRPLKDIVYLDFTDDPVELHRENAIIIPKFEGDTSDRNLHDLIPFLDRKYKFHFFILIKLFIFLQIWQSTLVTLEKKFQDMEVKLAVRNSTSNNNTKCNSSKTRDNLASVASWVEEVARAQHNETVKNKWKLIFV